MSPEGSLTITLEPRPEAGQRVSIRSSRQVNACRLFVGRRPAELAEMVPLIYRVCGTAQSAAVTLACEQATGILADPDIVTGRDLLVWLESAREHWWRIAIDWPRLVDGEMAGRGVPTGPAAALPEVNQVFAILRSAMFGDLPPFSPDTRLQLDRARLLRTGEHFNRLLEHHLFAMSPDRWLRIEPSHLLDRWLPFGGSSTALLLQRVVDAGLAGKGRNAVDTMPLPLLDEARLHQLLGGEESEEFAARPLWDGVPCESSPLTRQRHHPLLMHVCHRFGEGLLARMVARLVELALIARQIEYWFDEFGRQLPRHALPMAQLLPETTASGIRPGVPLVGIAQVEAARGRLIHRVELVEEDDGLRVGRYSLVAPTEWNFHPDGILARMLATLDVKDPLQLERQAALLINAVDPCVGYRLELSGHAAPGKKG
jgi:hypothetical protein